MSGPNSPSHVFKGFPLRDFVHPHGFSLDHILRTTSLKAELERHINGFSASEGTVDRCGGSRSPGRVRPSVVNPNAGAVATDGNTSQSFQDQLKGFLDGLYLGCFKSSVVQFDARRPPQRYIYDIGFNTDKLTGFIVANPFDTLVTFGPRGRHSPYGALDPALLRMPVAADIKVTPVVPEHQRTDRTIATIRPNFVTTFGTAVRDDQDADELRASVICDLNIRIVIDPRQELQQLSLYGDTMKVHLSKGLVQPVERSAANKWISTGKRLALDMGNRMITLRRNRLPTWGGPVDLGGTTVNITATNVVGRLHRIDLGGTVEKPLIVFDGVEILA